MKKLVILLTLAMLAGLTQAATDVYLAKYRGSLYHCELDGSDPSTLTTPTDYRVNGISVANNYIYTGEYNEDYEEIRRYEMDGSSYTVILSGYDVQNDCLRVANNAIYYACAANCSGTANAIYRVDLDGQNNTLLATNSYGNGALSVTDSGIYWLGNSRYIYKSDLDGANKVTLLNNSGDRTLGSMVTDGNYIYYTIDGGHTLNRRDMAGANLTVLLTDSAAIVDTTSLRILDGRLYWTSGEGGTSGVGLGQAVFSAAADGSEASATQEFSIANTFSDTVFNTYFELVPTPEPATMGLLAVGGLALLRRRRKA